MPRTPNTKRDGGGFDAATIYAVWAKANAVSGSPANLRKDRCGAWIQFEQYGNTASEFGWEIDHDLPVALGGTDTLSNLQPLQWQNNRHKSDSLTWGCLVSARN